jgi:hypothetical protein
MWYPTIDELKSAGAISGDVDNYRFAISGYGENPGLADFAKKLRENSFFAAFEASAPERFDTLVSKLKAGYLDGIPEGVIFDNIRASEIMPIIKARITKINNDLAAEYAALILEQYSYLRKINYRLCFQYAAKGGDGISQYLSQALLDKELLLNERALKTTPLQNPTKTPTADELYEKIFLSLSKKYKTAELEIFSSENILPRDYGIYCNIAVSMFEEILKLPKADIGIIIRNMFST